MSLGAGGLLGAVELGLVVLLGVVVLLSNLGKPRIAALHGSDILGLISSGICFGVAFVGLMGRLQLRSD